MKRIFSLVLVCLVFLPAGLFADDDLPPIFAEGEGGSSTEEEFDLLTLFGEGLTFVGKLDIWARYYNTDDNEFGNYNEGRFLVTSRSGNTKLELLGIINAYGGYDAQFSPDEFDWRLDRANVSWFTDWLELRLGRQRLAFGSGYMFNPSDLFVQPSMLDPTQDDPSSDALLTTFFLGQISGVNLIAVPGREIADGSYGLRLYTNLAGFDLAGSYYHRGAYTSELDAHFIGFSATGEIVVGDWDGPGIWCEGGLDLPYDPDGDDEVDSTWRASAGMNYTFTENFAATVEYYHDEAGGEEFVDYDWMGLMGGERFVLGRDYLFANLEMDLSALITLSAMSMVNLNDGSLMTGPMLRFNLSDNVEASLGGFLFLGDEETEFGHGEIDLGGGVNIPAFPHMAYLRVQAAF